MRKLVLLAALLGIFWFGQDIKRSNLYQTMERGVTQNLDRFLNQLHLQRPDPNNIQQQVGQVLHTIDQLDQQLVDQLLTRSLGIRNLPSLPEFHNPQTSDHSVGQIQVLAGDSGVTQADLQAAVKTIQNISLPILQQNLWKPTETTRVVLFSSHEGYANALRKSGIQASMIPSIVSKTGGLTVGKDVWIPLYASKSNAELADVLTHELTHTALNEQGIGEVIPTWVNEGIAWHNGMAAMNQVDPRMAQQMTNALNRQIQQVAQRGQLLPLSASEQDMLRARYNVEWEDYLAVENLIRQGGMNKFRTFLAGTRKLGVSNSFATQYSESLHVYENEFYQSLSGK
ncbi:hypothetical protein [Effusibacillus pohliae]|uniref:hypothetical protein n=1 Tax=Effusibacillus pohliae TaxID=232270 RepID=UPI000374ECD7|nr:hypothetical protein [Effusibacillus pohliae]